MNQQNFKRRSVEIIFALVLFLGAFFVFSLVFGFGEQLFKAKDTEQSSEDTQQQALLENILSEDGRLIEEYVPDPEPVRESERDYPAQRIINLQNPRPISLREAQENYQLSLELKRQQEELLNALDIEHNEPNGHYVLQFLQKLGSVNAQSFLVGDLDTGEIIFERKASEIYPIASVTKFFTAFTAARHLEANERTNITRAKLQVEGNRGAFQIGDSFTIRELLYPLLLVSSNDAGEIIAQQRDRTEFIQQMNTIAELRGLKNTAFADPTGLSQSNISNARDLFEMMRITKEDYPQIVGISQLSSKSIGDYTWRNINKATSFPEFRGGKTGFTNAARQTSIGYYEIKLSNGQTKNIGVVILQSNTRQQDTRNILDYLKEHVAYRLNEEI